MQARVAVEIGRLKLINPVMVASGTFGYAEEFRDFINLKKLGAIVTKTITLKPRQGNPPPRTCETPAGMLNSIGLENPGLEVFLKERLPKVTRIGIPVIVSIASEEDTGEFVQLAEALEKIKGVAALELNISCPNIKVHSSKFIVHSRKPRTMNHELRTKLIAQDAQATYEAVKAVRKATTKTLITKLSPNVTDIVEIAAAAENAGSDALALINTVSGMSIDTEKRIPKIAMVTAGLSGPAIRPIAVRMVWEVFRKVKIPIIGMGGVEDTASALEFMIAGAAAVAIGTAHFVNPCAAIEIIAGLKGYLAQHNIKDIAVLTGSLKTCYTRHS